MLLATNPETSTLCALYLNPDDTDTSTVLSGRYNRLVTVVSDPPADNEEYKGAWQVTASSKAAAKEATAQLAQLKADVS